ncbi:Cysteine-rich membrane protein 2 [Spironucleus salmonicida]|uniref:Cysteine-rich membrane protein 2 n=1 Tax=Spironucleus salmonicida TaxID=348837 RepID=V6LPM3_9EUKA|nr:Cysteine-rich membrane protein 2 [Spironucleus salmonicida]|eukprot:EST42679.1 Cysteine-rich membrane protein 2 [Spironucleus salmonicida]
MSFACPINSFRALDGSCHCFPGFHPPECQSQTCSQMESCIGQCHTINGQATCIDASCADSFINMNNICQKLCKNCSGFCLTQGCVNCDLGYFKVGNICQKCRSPCQSCISLSFCTQCQSGFLLINNKCSSCPQNCQMCSSQNICAVCKDNYILYNNRCEIGCDNVLNCAKCVNFRCHLCHESYILSQNSCQRCSLNCVECNSTQCTKCLSFFSVSNGVCIQCQIPFCDACIEPNKCIKCADLTNLVDNRCINCTQMGFFGCERCTSEKCLSCNKEYFMQNGHCILNNCSLFNCSQFQLCIGGNICICKPGFELIFNTCQAIECEKSCISGCMFNKFKGTKCLNCIAPLYQSKDGFCVKKCLNCKQNEICQYEKVCSQCPLATYPDENQNICVKCPISCIVCNKNECKQCIQNTVLSNKQCISCLQNGCKTCNGQGCLTCNQGFQFKDFNCYQDICLTCLTNEICTGTECLCAENYIRYEKLCVPESCQQLCQVDCQDSVDGKICPQILCKDGFILLNSVCVLKCDSCLPNQFCNNSKSCQNCDQNFFFDQFSYTCRSGLQCGKNIVFNCITCNEDICTACSSNLIIINNVCVPPLICKIPNCEICESKIKCIQCLSSFLPAENGTICSTVIPSCKIQNCYSCPSSSICNICFDPFKPTQNGLKCATCGLLLGCVKCQDNNDEFCAECDEFSVFDGAKCIQCQPGQISSQNECKPQISCQNIQFCNKCSIITPYICDECVDGSEIDTQGSLCSCSAINYCGVCFQGICVQCFQGFDLIDGKCYQQVYCAAIHIVGCQQCLMSQCVNCITGYGIDIQNTCQPCDQLCSKCSKIDQCRICKNGELPVYGKCGCSSNCQFCKKAFTCNECEYGYYLNGLECVINCQDFDKIEVFEQNKCGLCATLENCIFCDQDNIQKCFICEGNVKAKNGKCNDNNLWQILLSIIVICAILVGIAVWIVYFKKKKLNKKQDSYMIFPNAEN